jgi:lipoprotein-anchoring transpeptidase ErfK/SrfK
MKKLSRRDLLKLGLLTAGSLAFNPIRDRLPAEDRQALEPLKLVRVAITQDEVRERPSLDAPVLFYRKRDEIVKVLDEIVSDEGPEHNPRWYRVIGGYMHTAHLAPVTIELQEPVESVRDGGQVFQVSVPYARSMRWTEHDGWVPAYRLYYGSNHWVVDIDEGPDGEAWYRITDDLLHVDYLVPATSMRLIHDAEYSPIRPDNLDKKIKVSIARQTVQLFEGGDMFLEGKVSTGMPSYGQVSSNGIPTDTPKGDFRVSIKTPVRHMGDGYLTSDIFAYELPGVPWSTFFTETGVAFHGTYWHDNYGGRMSHGCVNMTNDFAQFLFRWTTPAFYPDGGVWHVNGYGTLIEVT